MVGYIMVGILVVYFFILWPRFEGLPPKSHRVRRQRLAGRLGLHNTPSVILLPLTENEKHDLVNLIEFYDMTTYTNVAWSNYFYVVEGRASVFSLYCSLNGIPPFDVDYNALSDTKWFMKINIQDFLLERFLREYAATHLPK